MRPHPKPYSFLPQHGQGNPNSGQVNIQRYNQEIQRTLLARDCMPDAKIHTARIFREGSGPGGIPEETL